MIHSARPIGTPVANIAFCCFVFLDLKSGNVLVRTCAKTMIITGRDSGLAEWINNTVQNYWLECKNDCVDHSWLGYLAIEMFSSKDSKYKIITSFTFKSFCSSVIFFYFVSCVPQKPLTCLIFDPLGSPTVLAGSDHCFRKCFRPSVRPHFSKYR